MPISDFVMVFDIETVPDQEVPESDGFPKPTSHKIVAISFVEAQLVGGGPDRHLEILSVRSGGEIHYSERELVAGFFQHIEKRKPRLVTYNGRGFDIPVLRYRALKHGVSAPWFAKGDSRWESYGSRYSVEWHCDLMDALADFGAVKASRLEETCRMLGVPGKLGVDGSMVKDMVDAGRLKDVRDYCELDVLSTFLVFLRFALFRGELTPAGHHKSEQKLREYLQLGRSERPHLGTFLDAWAGGAPSLPSPQ